MEVWMVGADWAGREQSEPMGVVGEVMGVVGEVVEVVEVVGEAAEATLCLLPLGCTLSLAVLAGGAVRVTDTFSRCTRSRHSTCHRYYSTTVSL